MSGPTEVPCSHGLLDWLSHHSIPLADHGREQGLHQTTSINRSVELALAAHPHYAAIHYPDATELRPIWVTSLFVPVTFATVGIVAHPAEFAG